MITVSSALKYQFTLVYHLRHLEVYFQSCAGRTDRF